MGLHAYNFTVGEHIRKVSGDYWEYFERIVTGFDNLNYDGCGMVDVSREAILELKEKIKYQDGIDDIHEWVQDWLEWIGDEDFKAVLVF